ncbi:MAG TPA: hypothetical protein VF669_00110 [Tepidisphaeraceae bacterium]|jgi:hypothetical protein
MALALDHPAHGESKLGLCLDCNYPLHGLPTPRCPECGRNFDPADPLTMNMGRELTSLMLWVLGPIRGLVGAASWAALFFALWSARLPGGKVRASASLWVLVALGLVWLIWPVLRGIYGRKYGWPTSLLMQGQKQRVLVGIAMVLSAIAIWYRLPLKAGIAISRPAMERMAKNLVASGNFYANDQWVGVYPAKHIKVVPGGVRFTSEDSDVTYKAGFAYLPNVDPKKSNWKTYRFIGNGWWTWREEG